MRGGTPLRVGACLSLSGRFSRFGRQAARALQAWAALDGQAQVLIEDDASDVGRLRAVLPWVAAASDLLLGPYSTLLMRAAGELAAEADRTVWNHGGSGDDVETAHPGRVISVLTPARRYAEPFLAHLASGTLAAAELRIAHGTGRFGRQVAAGAEAHARQLGITRLTTGPAGTLLTKDPPGDWTLLAAGTFEDDIQTVARARSLANPPQVICAVAAGVRDFGKAVTNPAGTFGIAQWFPHTGQQPQLGPTEDQFLTAYGTRTAIPDYPAVQAAAAAAIAAHCARLAGTTRPQPMWQAASSLDTTTLFDAFKIDPATGAQTSHQTILLQWTDTDRLTPA
ncbi:MAG TPA: ABC transporter substrate-binding protein [Streptosporangiaceae bacterium]|nr:ABC transporter substrate-binding protein [Streptosporangiaceae bacterium]